MNLEKPYTDDQLDEFFADIPIVKVGFFTRIKLFFKRIFSRRKTAEQREYESDAYSKFKHFYYELDKTDPDYLSIRHAATLCDDALRVATQRLKISKRLNHIEAQLGELDAFMNLTEEEITNLKKMLERFVAMAKERGILLEKLTEYDSSLVSMEPLAEDARAVIPSIKDAEKQQRALRMDIGYLTGEKEELAYERGDMQKNLQFIRKCTIITLGVFAFIAASLVAMAALAQTNILVPTFLLVVVTMAFVVTINVFRLRVTKEIKINTKKQQRAVELLNKKSVVYAYYTNFLRYCYKKYKANNSRTLENNLNDLESYRHLTNRIDTIRKLMYETEIAIERFVREKKLGGVKSTIEGFAKTINLDDKRRRFLEINAEKQISDKTLLELDKRHEEIWHTLLQIKSTDTTGTITGILEAYMAEAEKLFAPAKEEEKEESRPIWKLFEVFAEGEEGLSEEAQKVSAEITEEMKKESAKNGNG